MMKRKTKGKGTQWLYWFSFAIAVIVVYNLISNFTSVSAWIGNLISVLMPFMIGVLIAYLLYLPCRKIESWYKKAKISWIAKKARVLSVTTVYLIALILLILAFHFIVPTVTQSLIDLVSNFNGYYTSAMEKISQLPDDSFLKSQTVQDAISNIQNINLNQYFNMERLAQYAKGIINIAGSIFDIFVAIVVSVYVLVERRQIINFIKKVLGAIFEQKTCKMIGRYFNRTNEVFFRFLASQGLDAIVVGILTSIAMSLLGVRYAVLLGFFIGVSNLIPYFGAIVGVAISVIITIFTGGLSQAIWMAIIVIILQQIDANIINPKIVGGSLKMSPLLVILAVTIGGAYFGILGMFLAVPVFAVLKILISDFVDYKEEEKKKKEQKKEVQEMEEKEQ